MICRIKFKKYDLKYNIEFWREWNSIKPLWSSAEITLQILQESERIIDVFSTALHPRCAGFVYEWTSNCALSTNSKTFLKKLEENNKIPLETTISIRVHRRHCVYTLN